MKRTLILSLSLLTLSTLVAPSAQAMAQAAYARVALKTLGGIVGLGAAGALAAYSIKKSGNILSRLPSAAACLGSVALSCYSISSALKDVNMLRPRF
jgi:hypothetical protein